MRPVLIQSLLQYNSRVHIVLVGERSEQARYVRLFRACVDARMAGHRLNLEELEKREKHKEQRLRLDPPQASAMRYCTSKEEVLRYILQVRIGVAGCTWRS